MNNYLKLTNPTLCGLFQVHHVKYMIEIHIANVHIVNQYQEL